MSKPLRMMPCPWCGETCMSSESDNELGAWVMCDVCGAQGPVADDEEAAATAWQKRASSACGTCDGSNAKCEHLVNPACAAGERAARRRA